MIRNIPSKSVAVALSDTVNQGLSGVYVGVAGNISMLLEDDTAAQVWLNVPQGTYIGARIKRINVTGTTATNLIGVIG